MKRIAIAAILAGLGTMAAMMVNDDKDSNRAGSCMREAPHVSAVQALSAGTVSRSLALLGSPC